MPYAMSIIVSRAIPEIDGFKPSHRKLLYTMYKMGLLNGGRTKSANIVGSTMRLNPHGDQAIYEWRGAHPELFVNYAPEKDYYLKNNFRSVPNIVCSARRRATAGLSPSLMPPSTIASSM